MAIEVNVVEYMKCCTTSIFFMLNKRSMAVLLAQSKSPKDILDELIIPIRVTRRFDLYQELGHWGVLGQGKNNDQALSITPY